MAEAEPDPKKSSRRRIGCLAVIVAAAAVIGGGVWLGQREDASKSPCARSARAAGRALANCHSGAMDHARLLSICEQEVEPDEACLGRLSGVSCESIEKSPAVVVDLCRKKP